MDESSHHITCIACAVFQAVLESLRERGDFDLPVRYLDSMLHMRPKELSRRLEAQVQEESDRGNQALLLYGDCDPYMADRVSKLGVGRVPGINCFDILLGHDRFRRLREEGAFFLLPEWACRWREVIHIGMGSQRENIRCLMTDMHTKLIYVDLGSAPIPEDHLNAFSNYVGLPWEVLAVSPDHLKATIDAAEEELRRDAS